MMTALVTNEKLPFHFPWCQTLGMQPPLREGCWMGDCLPPHPLFVLPWKILEIKNWMKSLRNKAKAISAELFNLNLKIQLQPWKSPEDVLRSQISPKITQDHTRSTKITKDHPRSPKMPKSTKKYQKVPKITKSTQKYPKSIPKVSKSIPRVSKSIPKVSKSISKESPNYPRSIPKVSQKYSKSTQMYPKSVPKSVQKDSSRSI